MALRCADLDSSKKKKKKKSLEGKSSSIDYLNIYILIEITFVFLVLNLFTILDSLKYYKQ